MADPRPKLADFALGLPGAQEDFPWGDRVVKVRGKIFVVLGGTSPAITVKLVESHAHVMSVEGAAPTGYGLGKAGWVSVPVTGVPIDTLRDAAYDGSFRSSCVQSELLGARPFQQAGGALDVGGSFRLRRLRDPYVSICSLPVSRRRSLVQLARR